jgi:hypothetical protein
MGPPPVVAGQRQGATQKDVTDPLSVSSRRAVALSDIHFCEDRRKAALDSSLV